MFCLSLFPPLSTESVKKCIEDHSKNYIESKLFIADMSIWQLFTRTRDGVIKEFRHMERNTNFMCLKTAWGN